MTFQFSRMGLGTAQFGSDYGISNESGTVARSEVLEIFRLAVNHQIFLIDTSGSYGNAEQKVGFFQKNDQFDIVTKILVNRNCENLRTACRNQLFESLKNLGVSKVYGVLLHRASDLFTENGSQILDILLELQAQKFVDKIGVSIYTAKELDAVASVFSPDIIQVPYSVADRRLELSGYIKDLKRAKIEIHARSIFLQGLLLIEKGTFPKRFLEIEDEIMLFRESAKDSGLSVLEACIFTALRIKEFDKVLIGVTSANEFIEIINSCSKFNMENEFPNLYLPLVPDNLLNPSNW